MKSKPEDKHFKGKNVVLASVASIKQENGAGKKVSSPVLVKEYERNENE